MNRCPPPDDLRRLLAEDGLPGVEVLATSARTGSGVDRLRQLLADAVQGREARVRRLEADLDRLAWDVARQAGWGPGTSTATPGRIGRREKLRLVEALSIAAGVPVVADAAAAWYARGARGVTGWPFTRWARRLRPDPLRRLHLSPAAKPAAEQYLPGRSSLPEPSPVARAQVDGAVRELVRGVSDGLPAWEVEAVRQVAATGGPELAAALDRAVTSTDLGLSRRPLWWSAAGAVQVLLAVAGLIGLAWLGVIFVVGWLQLPELPTPRFGGFAVPTVLLLGGFLGGLVLGAVFALPARLGARRRRRRAERRLRTAVEEVAEQTFLAPVRRELVRYGSLRDRVVRLS